MAQYYAKHFGCRMVEVGLPVPDSLREFLSAGAPMADSHLGLVYNDGFHRDRQYRSGLVLSPDLAYCNSS